ncbi:phospholipase D-like domain-containing protein [Hydrogenimonas sp.]
MWQQLLTGTALAVLGELLIVLAFLHMLSVRRSPGSMIAWTLAIFLLPWVAVPLYFLFGHRKLLRRYQKLRFTLEPAGRKVPLCDHPLERLLCANAVPPATGDNEVALTNDPQEAYRWLMASIRAAEEAIDICVYELKLDDATRPLLEAMARRAREGVRVRILMDSIGSAGLYLWPRRLDFLKRAGVELAWFMPFLHLPTRNFVNLRNHRKLYIFDRATLYTGGMNLTAEYLSPGGGPTYYDDILFRIGGSAVALHRQIFEADWAFATATAAPHPVEARSGGGQACIQTAPSGPDTPSDGVVEALLGAIYTAQKRIAIYTPYFVPNEEFMRAFAVAIHRGVAVRIVVPERSDHLISDLGRGSYLRELAAKGAEILLYTGGILHAKAMLFDQMAVIGSVNFDNRSLFYNFEVADFIYSAKEVAALERWGKQVAARCRPYRASDDYWRIHLENFMRMVAPLV